MSRRSRRAGIRWGHDRRPVRRLGADRRGRPESPDLHAWLLGQQTAGIVVCGITTNHCCETTVRVGAHLGHNVTTTEEILAGRARPID
ncbi:isochorismatase family protein [Nocardioides koreensis]|uniref:isochorismatase family protein n=1 Tax=Nocardioides koreensis TaxID=433651 RepID=UPI0031E338F7